MPAAGVLKGFAKSEVRLVARAETRVLVSRLVARGRILVLSLFALLALVVPALDLRLETVVLRCSRDEGACTVSGGEAGTRTIPLSSIVRFAARQPRKQKPHLLALTESREILLVYRWPHAELTAHAAALDELLREHDGPATWEFTYGRRAQALREDLPIFGTLFAVMVLLVGTQLGWRTVLDRRAGKVVRWKPLSRSVRPIDAFRVIVVRSMAEAHPGRRAGQSLEMNAVLEAHHQITLVDATGDAWPITRFVTCPREEIEARAAEVAVYLNLPVAARPPELIAKAVAPAKPPRG